MSPVESNRRRTGRKKIPLEKIQSTTSRQVTFSKRRAGISKKASELCILCEAEVAVIIFSPAEKVFSFGNPFVDTIVNRYLDQNDGGSNNLYRFNAHARQEQLQQCTELENQLVAEKKRGESMEQWKKSEKIWCSRSIDDLGLQELERMKQMLGGLRNKVERTLESRRYFPQAYGFDDKRTGTMPHCDAYGC